MAVDWWCLGILIFVSPLGLAMKLLLFLLLVAKFLFGVDASIMFFNLGWRLLGPREANEGAAHCT